MTTIFRRRQVVTSTTPSVVVARRAAPGSLLALCAGTLVLLIFLGVLLTRGSDDQQPMSQSQVAGVGSQARAFGAQQSTCGGLIDKSDQVRELLSKGQVASGVVLAADALSQPIPPACADAHATLARVWYGADLDYLLSTAPEDESLARQTPTRWMEIESRADQLGVPKDARRPAIQVARTAYDRGLWQLADAGFRKASDAGALGVDSVEFRHALLRNWGRQLASQGTVTGRERGLVLLATANAIARTHDLQTDVACADMRALGIVDCSKMVPDPGEPTLAGQRPANPIQGDAVTPRPRASQGRPDLA